MLILLEGKEELGISDQKNVLTFPSLSLLVATMGTSTTSFPSTRKTAHETIFELHSKASGKKS